MSKYKEQMDVTKALPEFYLPYASYVLQTRALPDARDGLKTGARFILYAQHLSKLTYKNKKRKASSTIQATMQFSVHGDASIYGNAIRMSQDFSLRYPVIETQGSNGSVVYGANTYAASRYVEMRSNPIAGEMLELVDKETVDKWKWNYTQEKQYPTVLPTKFPFSLVNGNTGIGVGCSSSIPQFNIVDVSNALIKMLDDPDVAFEDIYCPIDFATGGIIINETQVKESLRIGHGKAACIRAKIEYYEKTHELIVREIPYQTSTSGILAQIQKKIDENVLLGVDSAFDGTDKDGIQLCVKLNKNAVPDRVVAQLYKETSLQSYYSINMMMLKEGQYPTLFNWKTAMESYLDHLKDVIKKGYEFDLRKILDRLEIVEGYLIALEDIDNVIELIQKSSNSSDAQEKLVKKYNLSDRQAKSILSLRLSRLVGLEKIKLQDEAAELGKEQKALVFLLENETAFSAEIRKEILRIRDTYQDARRTKNIDLIDKDNDNDEPVEQRNLIVHLTNLGNLYTSETTTLIAQTRGGKGSKLKLLKNEYVIETLTDTNEGLIMMFSNKGQVYICNLDDLTVGASVHVNELFKIETDEKFNKMISFNKTNDYKFIVFTTKNGLVKKSLLSEYKVKKSNGVIAIKIRPDDEIVDISFMNDEPLGILTEKGHFLIIDTREITPIGRVAQGVKGITLNKGDFVSDANVIPPGVKEFVSVTDKGLIKRTAAKDCTIASRATKGSIIQKTKDEDGTIAGFLPIGNEKEIVVVSNLSMIKIKNADILLSNRGAFGAKAMKISSNEKVLKLIRSI